VYPHFVHFHFSKTSFLNENGTSHPSPHFGHGGNIFPIISPQKSSTACFLNISLSLSLFLKRKAPGKELLGGCKNKFSLGVKPLSFLKKGALRKGLRGTRFYCCKRLQSMKLPAIVVNVKTYREGTGRKAMELSKIMEKVSDETGVSMAIAVQAADIRIVADEVAIPVFAQHMDAITYGSHTGWILPESVKDAGASGVLLNHSEHPMKIKELAESVRRAKEVRLEIIICTNNIEVTGAAAALSPDFVAIEPPELIGGDISVTKAEPGIVRGAAEIVEKINPSVRVLCGAGVKSGEDVKKAIELGSVGVLLASGVVKAKDKEKVLMDLASAIE